MNGVVFFVCSTSWNLSVFSRSHFQEKYWAWDKLLPWGSMLQMSRWIRSWIQVLLQGSTWQQVQGRDQNQQRILKRGNKTIRVKGAAGSSCKVTCVNVWEAPGNKCKVLKTILNGRVCISTVCKSQIIITLTKSSSFDRKSVPRSHVLDREDQCIDLGLFMSTTMNLGPSYDENLGGCVQGHQLRRAQDVVRQYSKIDLGTIIRSSECIYDDTEFHPWMRSTLCHHQVTKWQRQRCMSTQIQFCVWKRYMITWSFRSE